MYGTGDDALEVVAAGLSALAGEVPAEVSVGLVGDRVAGLVGVGEGVRVELVRWVARSLVEGVWELDGSGSPVAWLVGLGLGRAEACRVARSARLVARFDATAAALEAGAISTTQLDGLARRVTPERAELFAEFEDALLDAASALDDSGFVTVVARWSAYADDVLADPVDGTDPDHDRRGVGIAPLENGCVAIEGFLDPSNGAPLWAAVDALSGPDPAGGEQRSARQRRADALGELGQFWLAHRADDRPGGPTATVDIVVELATLLATHPAPTDPGETGPGRSATTRPDTSPTAPADPTVVDLDAIRRRRATIDGLGEIPAWVAGRFACDSLIGRVLTADSLPLDVGRRVRTFTPAQRRALHAHHHGCAWPGCDRPASHTELHHNHPWAQGGPTDLHNATPYCHHHHTLIHLGHTPPQTHHPTGTDPP